MSVMAGVAALVGVVVVMAGVEAGCGAFPGG